MGRQAHHFLKSTGAASVAPPHHPHMYQPEVALWRAVIWQQFLDAVAKDTLYSRRTRSRLETDDARAWLLTDLRTFPAVCRAAAVSARKVRAEAVRQARLGWPARQVLADLKGVFA